MFKEHELANFLLQQRTFPSNLASGFSTSGYVWIATVGIMTYRFGYNFPTAIAIRSVLGLLRLLYQFAASRNVPGSSLNR